MIVTVIVVVRRSIRLFDHRGSSSGIGVLASRFGLGVVRRNYLLSRLD